MPVWSSSRSGGGSSGGESGDGGGDGGFDVNRVVENIAERALNDPQMKVQIANQLQDAGIPPRLLFDEIGAESPEAANADPQPQPMPDNPDPNADAQRATETPQNRQESEAVKITPSDVNDFLQEVEAVLGADATIADLQELDDGMVQTALDMSDLPS